jgi:hypothetical protein
MSVRHEIPNPEKVMSRKSCKTRLLELESLEDRLTPSASLPGPAHLPITPNDPHATTPLVKVMPSAANMAITHGYEWSAGIRTNHNETLVRAGTRRRA